MKMNFSQARSGYNIEEVDEAVVKLQNQIEELKKENISLSETLNQYTAKIIQLVENTKKLDDERAKESLRFTKFLNQVAQMAEQNEKEANRNAKEILESARCESTEILEKAKQEVEKLTKYTQVEMTNLLENARSEADKIRNQAQIDFKDVGVKLKKLNEITQYIRKSNENYLSETNARLEEVNNFVDNALSDISDNIPLVSEVDDSPEEGSYEEFVRNMNLSGEKPKYKKENDDIPL